MRKAFFLVLIILILLSSILVAQITFQHTFSRSPLNDVALSVEVAQDSGYFVCGYSLNSAAAMDIFLIRLNKYGDTLWSKSFSTDGSFLPHGMAITADNGVIISGAAQPNINNYGDLFLLKTDSIGNYEWSKLYGDTLYDLAFSIIQTPDMGYFITGTKNILFLTPKMYVVKTDSAGVMQWDKTFEAGLSCFTYAGKTTSDGGYIITGDVLFPTGDTDILIIKMNSSGTLLWSKTIGLSDYDTAIDIITSDSTGFVLTGTTESAGAGGQDIYLIKTDTSGNIIWAKTYGGSGDENAFEISSLGDEGFIIAAMSTSVGFGGSDALLIKTDSAGVIQWSKAYGGPDDDRFDSVKPSVDGGYIAAGTKTTSFGFPEYFIVKTDSVGNTGCYDVDAILQSYNFSPTVNPLNGIESSTGTTTPFIPLFNFENINSVYCAPTYLTEQEGIKNNITIYPNPANTTLNIETGKLSALNSFLIISDVAGRAVISKTISSTSAKHIVDISSLSRGIYFVQLEAAEGIPRVKFVKD